MSSPAEKIPEPTPGTNEPRKDVHELQGSTHTGLAGFYETILRRFKTVMHIMTLAPMYLLGAACMGTAIIPGASLLRAVHQYFKASGYWSMHPNFQLPFYGIAAALGYFFYGFSLIFLIPIMNFLLRSKLKAWRGTYYSFGSLRWYIHNGLTYIVRYTFLEFVTPTPFNILFYRLMGMKIGRGTQINSTHISDPSLIELGEKVTVGGSAAILGHYGMGGFLVLSPVKIGNHVTIGLKASVMGGVTIGDHAKILPHSVVLPKTKIPAHETWGGIPAQKIDKLPGAH